MAKRSAPTETVLGKQREQLPSLCGALVAACTWPSSANNKTPARRAIIYYHAPQTVCGNWDLFYLHAPLQASYAPMWLLAKEPRSSTFCLFLALLLGHPKPNKHKWRLSTFARWGQAGGLCAVGQNADKVGPVFSATERETRLDQSQVSRFVNK